MREIIYHRKLLRYGADILYSPGMQLEKDFLQHGEVSVFAHSIAVACVCLLLARLLHRCLKIRLNERALVRGALLHDYFLYDWHVPDKSHRLHGFFHARRALRNASRDFALGEIERFVEQKYHRAISFKARLAGGGERLDTIYVSDEELKANIHMDITIED